MAHPVYSENMAVNNGEPGNCYEAWARQQVAKLKFSAPVEDPMLHRDWDGTAYVIHPAAIGPEMHKVIFTNCPGKEINSMEFNDEFNKATTECVHHDDPLSNSDRSTIVGCDAVVIMKWCMYCSKEGEELDPGSERDHLNFYYNYDCIRRNLYIAEIKLKVDGVVDSAAMGATAHRAWIMEAAGVHRNWAVITDGDNLAPMLKNPKSKNLTTTDDIFYTPIVVPPPPDILKLRSTIIAAGFDTSAVCRLVRELKKSAGVDMKLSPIAQKLVDYVDDYDARQKTAAEACAVSKSKRHELSHIALEKEKRRVSKRKHDGD